MCVQFTAYKPKSSTVHHLYSSFHIISCAEWVSTIQAKVNIQRKMDIGGILRNVRNMHIFDKLSCHSTKDGSDNCFITLVNGWVE